MTTTSLESPSRFLAAEVRAECGRQGISHRELARRMGVNEPWLTRRIGTKAAQPLTLEDLLQITKVLGVNAQDLVTLLLPRLDSNQQPSGYRQPLVSRSVFGLAV